MPADEDSDEDPRPKKPETRKVPKKEPAPPSKTGTGKTKKITSSAKPAEPSDDDEPAPKKTGTGKVNKPPSKTDTKGTGKVRRPAPAGPPPAQRGGLDYVLALLAPLVGGGVGAFAFLQINAAMAACKTNPLLADLYPNPAVDIPGQVLKESSPLLVVFPPAPIIVGAVMGLIGTFCFLKMAPGMGARLMGGVMLAFAAVTPIPFLFAGQSVLSGVKQLLKDEYDAPRGGEVDPRAVNFSAPDFEKRRLLFRWKVGLDDGAIPLAFIATSEDPVPTDKVPDDEKKIKSLDLYYALATGRAYVQAKKVDEEVWKKIQDLKDKANQEISTPGEETTKLDEQRRLFDGRYKKDNKISKPGPRKEPWFGRWVLKGDASKTGTAADDCAYYHVYYLGKALHAACKELPADMRYAACFKIEVLKDAPVEPITRFDFVWLCYDIEKPEREPILVPQLSALLSEARFKIEVLGEK